MDSGLGGWNLGQTLTVFPCSRNDMRFKPLVSLSVMFILLHR